MAALARHGDSFFREARRALQARAHTGGAYDVATLHLRSVKQSPYLPWLLRELGRLTIEDE